MQWRALWIFSIVYQSLFFMRKQEIFVNCCHYIITKYFEYLFVIKKIACQIEHAEYDVVAVIGRPAFCSPLQRRTVRRPRAFPPPFLHFLYKTWRVPGMQTPIFLSRGRFHSNIVMENYFMVFRACTLTVDLSYLYFLPLQLGFKNEDLNT